MSPRQDETSEPLLYARWMADPYRVEDATRGRNADPVTSGIRARPGLSKSVDSDILFDIDGRTLLLGRAKFCLVTGFACGKVVFPKYLDDGIPPFVRRLFSDKLKKLEKNKAGLEEASKGKAAQPSDKSDKDSVTIGHLGELVPDKAEKGKATQPSDKDDKVSVTIRDIISHLNNRSRNNRSNNSNRNRYLFRAMVMNMTKTLT
ncbi:hypothetical protein Tco_0111125 [Tanacetum coccineum]